ncbi:Sacsin [Gigaspora margarita]|uniref:Sacsin n=1 Tax=Gigaspora margarita TaxID=4874 RepID=A0A8H4B4N0_GIGMA|nr:Sacsin [Gigaspora margarita]
MHGGQVLLSDLTGSVLGGSSVYNCRLKNYVIEIDDIAAVLLSLEEIHSFPSNFIKINPSNTQRKKLASYIRQLKIGPGPDYVKAVHVIKHIPLFAEVNKDNLVTINSLFETGKEHFLLPKKDESLCGPIISPSAFLETHTSEDLCFILESVLEIKRLNQEEYWKEHVIKHLISQQPDIKEKLLKNFLNDGNLSIIHLNL